MPRARRTDANHAAVRDALRRCGWTVHDLSAAGRGVPDLLCVRAGRLLMVEVKDGSKPPSARTLTQEQRELHAAFAAAGAPVVIVTSAEQAARL